jgi:hypothetical protein
MQARPQYLPLKPGSFLRCSRSTAGSQQSNWHDQRLGGNLFSELAPGSFHGNPPLAEHLAGVLDEEVSVPDASRKEVSFMKVIRKWAALRSERAGAVRPAGKHFKWIA